MSHPNLLCALLIHELRVVVFFIAAVVFTVFGKQTAKCKRRKDHCEMATGCCFAKNLPPAEHPQPTWRRLPYVQGVSELVARHLRPYTLNIAHTPTESLRKTLVHVKDPLHTQRLRNVVYTR